MSRIRWILPALVLLGLACLNTAEFQRGSWAFSEQFFVNEFTPSRGWPFRAYARANHEGAVLIDASVVQGDTRVYRDRFDGAYPHLAVNPVFVVLDLLVGGALVVGAFFVTSKFVRARRAEDAGGTPALPGIGSRKNGGGGRI